MTEKDIFYRKYYSAVSDYNQKKFSSYEKKINNIINHRELFCYAPIIFKAKDLIKNRKSKEALKLINYILSKKELKFYQDNNLIKSQIQYLKQIKSEIFSNLNQKPQIKKQHITAMLAIKNEEKYIESVLSHLSKYVDSIAILDDASTDNTINIVKSFDKVKILIKNEKELPRHEGRDRNRLFKSAKMLKPDWFICLDGDEIFEDKIIDQIQKLCHNKKLDGYLFKIYNFWQGKKNYRIDGLWDKQLRLKLFRNLPKYKRFQNKKLHIQTVPVNLPANKIAKSKIRIKHYGYSDYSDAKKKYLFYEKEDEIKDIKEIGNTNYYHLIDESNLKLAKWHENN